MRCAITLNVPSFPTAHDLKDRPMWNQNANPVTPRPFPYPGRPFLYPYPVSHQQPNLYLYDHRGPRFPKLPDR
jgi:hypothetical protein